MTDIHHNKQPLDLILDGFAVSDKGEADAFEGYLQTARGIAMEYDKAGGSSNKLRSALEKLLKQSGKTGEIFRTQYGKLLGHEGDKASQTAASALRTAYVWLHKNPEQVAWVQVHKASAKQPTTMHKEWKLHQSAQIKRGVDDGLSEGQIADSIPGTVEKLDEAIDKVKKAKARSIEKKREEAEAQVIQPELDRGASSMDADELADFFFELVLSNRTDAKAVLTRLQSLVSEDNENEGLVDLEGPFDPSADYVAFYQIEEDISVDLPHAFDLDVGERHKLIKLKGVTLRDGVYRLAVPAGTRLFEHCLYDEGEKQPITSNKYGLISNLRIGQRLYHAGFSVSALADHAVPITPDASAIAYAKKAFSLSSFTTI